MSHPPGPDLDLQAQLERDIFLGVDEDADGEPDDEYEAKIPRTIALRQEEEEEDDDSAILARAPSPPKSKPTRPKKSKATFRENRAAPITKPKHPAKVKGKTKREMPPSDVEEEDLEFGQPTRQTKRSRPPPPADGPALPGSSSLVHPPSTAYASSFALAENSDTTPVQPAASDSEEDWEPVPPPADTPPVIIMEEEGDEEEEEQEIDENAFEAEMDNYFSKGGASSEPVANAHPISLNQYAGGGAEASHDEDDYSSSEDSDEDE